MVFSETRRQFPALGQRDHDLPRVYLDNPAGTQLPLQALNRIRDYLIEHNANTHGAFVTSRASDALRQQTRVALADFLNANAPEEIVFGPNMTTLTFAISRSLGTWIRPGQEIILTRLDHDANISPWLQIAQEKGAVVRWLDFDRDQGTLCLEQFDQLLTDKTFLVALGYASNLLGTINPVQALAARAKALGALVFIDAVHYAPHGPIDVQSLNADFLVCSPYKFFGPHQGVLWGKLELLEKLPARRVRPASPEPPEKFETGTQSHEGQAGTLGALEYLAWIGQQLDETYASEFPGLGGQRLDLHCALRAVQSYEQNLSRHLLKRLSEIPGLRIHGSRDPQQVDGRVPTVSFTWPGRAPKTIAQHLARHNIFVWNGHAYALEVVRHLGLEQSGGVVRIGAVHYNTTAELDQLVETLKRLGL